MGNFETAIPKNIKQLEDEIKALNRKRYGLDWGHECDCEYCTEQQDIPEETQRVAAEIDAEVQEIKLTIARLKRHAADHHVEVAA